MSHASLPWMFLSLLLPSSLIPVKAYFLKGQENVPSDSIGVYAGTTECAIAAEQEARREPAFLALMSQELCPGVAEGSWPGGHTDLQVQVTSALGVTSLGESWGAYRWNSPGQVCP